MDLSKMRYLTALENEIVRLSPQQTSKNRMLFLEMDERMRAMLNTYMEFCLTQGDTIEYLAKSYLMLLKETWKEQMFFARNGRYRYGTYEEVKSKVYNNAVYMKMYMRGLCISTALWKNHEKMCHFFLDTLPKKQNESSGGGYLEIGPGHGFFLMKAMQATNYSSYKAVDISQTSVNMTKEILEFFKIDENYEVICSDFLQMPSAERYDAIVMGEVLEHVEEPRVFLEKVAALSHDKTHIYISTCMNAPEIDHIYLFSTLSEIEDLFISTGLEIRNQLVLPYQNETLEECIAKRLPTNLAYILSKR